MSFPTEQQQIRICQILNVMPVDLTWQLNWLNTNAPTPRLTAAMIAEIGNQIDLWDAGAGTDFTDIEARAENFGASINSERKRTAIRQRIAIFLERPDWGGGGSQVVTMRG